MKDKKFPKLANSLKEIQKLPEWSTIEKVMQHDSCKNTLPQQILLLQTETIAKMFFRPK